MARSNFGFQKHQKELKRKQKNEKKRQRSLDKKNQTPGDLPPDSPDDLISPDEPSSSDDSKTDAEPEGPAPE